MKRKDLYNYLKQLCDVHGNYEGGITIPARMAKEMLGIIKEEPSMLSVEELRDGGIVYLQTKASEVTPVRIRCVVRNFIVYDTFGVVEPRSVPVDKYGKTYVFWNAEPAKEQEDRVEWEK